VRSKEWKESYGTGVDLGISFESDVTCGASSDAREIDLTNLSDAILPQRQVLSDSGVSKRILNADEHEEFRLVRVICLDFDKRTNVAAKRFLGA